MKVNPPYPVYWGRREDGYDTETRYIKRLISRITSLSTRNQYKRKADTTYRSLRQKNSLSPREKEFIKTYREIFLYGNR